MRAYIRTIQVGDCKSYMTIDSVDRIEFLEAREFIQAVLAEDVINAHLDELTVRINDEVHAGELYPADTRDLRDKAQGLNVLLDVLEAWGYYDDRLYYQEKNHSMILETYNLSYELTSQWCNGKIWHKPILEGRLTEKYVSQAPSYNIYCSIELHKYSEDIGEPDLIVWVGTTIDNSVIITGTIPDQAEAVFTLTQDTSDPFMEVINKIKETLGYTEEA